MQSSKSNAGGAISHAEYIGIPLALIVLVSACSLKQRAVNTLADVLGEAESVYLSDDDPELIADALPFNLKTLETLLVSSPNHRGLLLSATKSFLLYTYAFVEPEIDVLAARDFGQAQKTRRRAARLYARAFAFGVRGLAVERPGFAEDLLVEPEAAVEQLELEDVPLAVWTAAALGALIGVSKDEPEATADIAVVGALLERALALDADFDEGTIHSFLVSYESARVGGSKEKARTHFDRAMELSGGRRLSMRVAWAESVLVADQNREEFERMLNGVLEVDVDADPENRLLNILAQRRACWLLARVDELFLPGGAP